MTESDSERLSIRLLSSTAAVVAATAWHWVDPRLRYQRAARALRPGGHLAGFDWTVDYGAEAYINLLRTFSGHIAMAPADRERLFTKIRQRLARRPSGTVRRGWGTVLHIARVRPGGS
jgi:SAM-dependent methyltransferase